MEWVSLNNPVLIEKHHYDELGKTLEIRFTSGTRWIHADVPLDLYKQFCTAEYPEAFWAMYIRQVLDGTNKRYPVIKVIDGDA